MQTTGYASFEVLLKSGETHTRAPFGRCLFDLCSEHEKDTLSCTLATNKKSLTLNITQQTPTDLNRPQQTPTDLKELVLGHSDECPLLQLTTPNWQPLKVQLDMSQELRVAVCAVLEHNNKYLLTRRSPQMRTFPLRWVFPGGHVDEGEGLEEAVAREVKEEIGLSVDVIEPIALWESCYPTYIDQGVTKRQHLVVFFRVILKERDIFPCFNQMKLQASELDAVTWLSLEDFNNISNRTCHNQSTQVMFTREGQEDKIDSYPLNNFCCDKEEMLKGKNEGLSMATHFIFQKVLSKL
eukprot:TRINITY_DN2777_c0_g1_i2.p2 TRINITY_DN2777_c0_g1~~TRINITY_DN2777_c0_g1_i2.p2  ORF type:complete len:296 (-),score=82.61 TRINITY_DN2777_c0_g1_i2:961-1848(-)